MVLFYLPESHCVKSVRIRSYSGPHFPAFGLNSRIQSECGKIRNRITPNTDTFHAVSTNICNFANDTTFNAREKDLNPLLNRLEHDSYLTNK